MSYRPEENWDERITNENLPLFKQGTQEWLHTFHGVKIGADAILEALRELGAKTYEQHADGLYLKIPFIKGEVKGTVVFIPDNE